MPESTAPPSPPPSPPPGLEPLADGVWAWIQPDAGPGVANAGVVADADGLTVVDTLMVPSQSAPFAEAVAALGLPVRRVVLTHAHIDQVGGTRAFPAAAIYATPATGWALDQPLPIEAYRAFMPDFADEFDVLAEIGTRPTTHEVTEGAQLTDRVEVLALAGHTAGDVVVLVADADLCFAGGLCSFGVAPLAFQGDPVVWADTLDVLAELADVVVPGHGPVGGPAEVAGVAAYLRACVGAAGDPARIPAGPWDSWTGRALADPVNVERAALLASGRDEIPPTMLRAMGR